MKRKKQTQDLSSGANEHPPKRSGSLNRALSLHEDEEEVPSTRASAVYEKSIHDSTPSSPTSLIEERRDQEKQSEEVHADEESDNVEDDDILTPLKSQNGRISNSINKRRDNETTPVKLLKGKRLFSTPVKDLGSLESNGSPALVRHADRSARRKSTKNIIERTIFGNTSDNEEEDGDIESYIYDSGEDEEPQSIIETLEIEPDVAPATPARRRGRPKGSKNKQRSPTPAHDLAPHEVYFSQNRGGHCKTSNNDLSSLELLDHEEYFSLLRNYEDPHTGDRDALQELYKRSFNQWRFELSQDFNICIYGWGSKRPLLLAFAEHIYKARQEYINNDIVVVNGYVHSLSIREVLNTIAATVSETSIKMGSQPAEMVDKLLAFLEENEAKTILLVIHSIDGPALRRPAIQTILSRLGSHPQIQLIASADHPSFPLLWDSSLRSTFNFLFHNCTTFEPYTSEADVVDEVHELLGRSGRRVGGKDGVSFVLKSLPENAKNLFRVLIGEQLAAIDEVLPTGFEEEDDYEDERLANNSGRNDSGVEYKVLYQKACEEFICSNEMSFRTLLKE